MFGIIICLALGWFAHKYREKWMPDVSYIWTRIKSKF